MLIEFSVSNYRSFREKQTFSMVAAPRLRKRENKFKPELIDESFPELLKVAAIYGPNASGKSNLLRALQTVSFLVYRVPSPEVTALPVVPFKFDKKLLNKPSVFETHFIAEGMRYQFNLEITQERIVRETLAMFPKGRETLLYDRVHTPNGDKYTFGSALEGGNELFSTWRKLTSPQVLFLSQAVANSNEELKQLRTPYSWFDKSLHGVLNGMSNLSQRVQDFIEDNPKRGAQIASFLEEFDVPITNVRVESSRRFSLHDISEDTSSRSLNSRSTSKRRKTFLTHHSALGNADIDYIDESDGTKNLMGFFLPWWTRDIKIPNFIRCVLTVDELDSSLHPKIVELLVDKHIHANVSTQIIFTTHDTHLMDSKLLRRDQFWLTERDINGATQLRSIHDFVGRESEDVEKRYYEGRYRSLPLIRKG